MNLIARDEWTYELNPAYRAEIDQLEFDAAKRRVAKLEKLITDFANEVEQMLPLSAFKIREALAGKENAL